MRVNNYISSRRRIGHKAKSKRWESHRLVIGVSLPHCSDIDTVVLYSLCPRCSWLGFTKVQMGLVIWKTYKLDLTRAIIQG